MGRIKSLFAKVELRLWHDHRFLVLTPVQRYCYIGLIALAKQTYNKIPKNLQLIKAFLRLECEDSEMQVTLDCIKQYFPKFRSSKHFYYFDDYPERYQNVPHSGRNGGRKGHRKKDTTCTQLGTKKGPNCTQLGTPIAEIAEKAEKAEEAEQQPPLRPPVYGENSGDQYLLTLYQKLHGVTRSPETVLAKIGSARSWGVTSKRIEERMYEMRNDGIKAEIWDILDPLVKEKKQPKPDLREDWEKIPWDPDWQKKK